MRDVLCDVDTTTFQELGLSQYVLFVLPVGKADDAGDGPVNLGSRLDPLHLRKETGDWGYHLSQVHTCRNEMSREIFRCSFRIPLILVSRISLQKSGSAAMSFYK